MPNRSTRRPPKQGQRMYVERQQEPASYDVRYSLLLIYTALILNLLLNIEAK